MKYEDLKKEDLQKLTALEKIEWLEFLMKETQEKLEECLKYVDEKVW